MMYPYRYLIFLLGAFSTYCGFIYNDMMSIPILFKDSCYKSIEGETDWQRKTPDCTVNFGIDSAWYMSSNLLTFMNSFKMKTAVIFGVL